MTNEHQVEFTIATPKEKGGLNEFQEEIREEVATMCMVYFEKHGKLPSKDYMWKVISKLVSASTNWSLTNKDIEAINEKLL